MQITYEEYRRQTGGGSSRRPAARKRKRNGSRPSLPRREMRRLGQLAASLALFLVVFLGRGAFPEQMEALSGLLRGSTDFQAAFSQLGTALSRGEPVTEALGDWCVAVFGASGLKEVPPVTDTLEEELAFLTSGSLSPETRMARYFGGTWEEPALPGFCAQLAQADPAEETGQGEQGASPEAPAEGLSNGMPPPEGATMLKVDLGLAQTVTPVVGVVTSEYGYRDHPVNGEYKFHTGVDLRAANGTDILAFADGVVDYIGESTTLGKYVQLRHANGVTTFYAHCSELLLPKGAEVTAGQVFARAGDTGNATGPHLHLEIQVNGVQVNPAYYIETAEEG